MATTRTSKSPARRVCGAFTTDKPMVLPVPECLRCFSPEVDCERNYNAWDCACRKCGHTWKERIW